MKRDAQSSRRLPFRKRTVRGEPYHVDGRTLVPVARIASFAKGRGIIGNNRVSGWGAGFVFTNPVAMEVETASGEQRIAIQDKTAAALRGILVAAVAITVLCTTIRCMVRRKRKAGTQ